MLLRFIKVERNAALLLVVAGLLGLILANLPVTAHLVHEIHPLHQASEYLLCLFFFLVGLELKRELTQGTFKNRRALLVPLLAAIMGALVPAGIYYLVTQSDSIARGGWAIPMATDITFALAVFSIFATTMPQGSRQFLMAFAIIDDILAIVVIALFLGAPIQTGALVTGSALLGMLVPTKYTKSLEDRIHPWVAYLVLPLFAFCALAVEVNLTVVEVVSSVVGLAILLRVVGKVVGITFGAWLGTLLVRKSGEQVLALADYARISVLGGIGFTVAFLVNDIVFRDHELEHAQALVASLLAAVLASVLAAVVFKLRKRN
jgi:NhaA family Na+:H+ antiporter